MQRKPRTLQPTSHATKAQISRKDLQEWIDDIAVGAAQFPPRTQTPGADCAASSSGRDAIDLTLFSTNDYLGLSTHSIVRSAAASAAAAYGSGPRSSTIVAGYTAAHRELETELATLKGTEDCILFPTGFAANCAAVSACMAGGDCVVFSDELNHASIIDGARLGSRSGAAVKIYKHNDMAHLEQLLQ